MAFSQIIKRSSRTLDILHSSIYSSSPSLSLLIYSSSSSSVHPRNFCNKTIENPHEFDPQIITEAEKLCKIISNHRHSSNLESLLSSTHIEIELSPALVTEVLKKLSNAGVFALSFFRWAENQSGFKHNSDTYNALIEALGKIKQFKMIWKLVNDMKIRGVLNKTTFALISRLFARAKMVYEAMEAFERMENFGFKPELCDLNWFLDTLCKSRQTESAQQVFDKMTKRKFVPTMKPYTNIVPTIKSYTILLEGWSQEMNLLKLDEVYRELKANGFEPDVVAYGIIINAYCKVKNYEQAINMFDEMKLKNVGPSPHIYCTLINSLGSENRLSEALKFYELFKSCGNAIDVPTYNAVVGSYCRSMRMDDAFRVVEEMKRGGVGPNSRTFDIILRHLVKARRKEKAYSVFRLMKSDFKCDPSVSTYEIMVGMLCNDGKMDMAMHLWEEMKGEGVLPGLRMFTTLIYGLTRKKKWQDACNYFEEMLDMGIRPPAHMFNRVKQALNMRGRKMS